MTMRERIANFVAGRKNPETGQRQGGIAGAFRGGNGQMMSNPISAFGDRIGRGIQRGLINRRIGRDTAESDQRRIDMIAADDPQRGRSVMAMPGPVDVANPRQGGVGLNAGEGIGTLRNQPLTASQRNALIFRGNQATNPNRDISARTSRAEGASAFDDVLKEYQAATKRNSWMQNQQQ